MTRLRTLLLGHPLKSSAQHRERLGFFLGLPLLAVDALSSIAYATEEILIALSLAGSHFLVLSIPIAFTIVIVLTSLIASYRQTVQAYPEGGGAYIVARNNLGIPFALVAASSLLIDYVLTVAVSMTASIRAICSAFPYLLNFKLSLCFSGLWLLTWINLRGIRESAYAVAFPVGAFIILIICLCIDGLFKTGISFQKQAFSSFDVFLDIATFAVVLRAFAGGCTAMAGIEAVANAGNMLTNPSSMVARQILLALGVILGCTFLSITIISQNLDLKPMLSESLLSQLTRNLWGDSLLYHAIQILTATVLFLAANTVFAGFPKLSAILAKDGWLPRQLSAIGDRLVFSKGILWLAILASLLILIFRGDTHALIPLYAIGVFSAFTLSQLGMVKYWRQHLKETSQSFWSATGCKMMLNTFGACLTGIALLVTFEAKFSEGAFLTVIVVPIIVSLCYSVKKHYNEIEKQLKVDITIEKNINKKFSHSKASTVIVPVSRVHKGTLEALRFARQMTTDVKVIIVDIQHDDTTQTKLQLEALEWDLDIIVLNSPYRSIIRPIIDYVHYLDAANGTSCVLILPEFIPARWWHNLLHNRTAEVIVRTLSWNERLRNQARIIINVPYYIYEDKH
ncbi:hypothetical protein IM40_08815 [Candidatus Paracaedimonas acanthamoebae]|nr:hypothetical protein IM40_08815 [Candidatus Paracaedimonas acanthamoebae]